MRLYQSLDYVNNFHSLNPFLGDNNNGNISGDGSNSEHNNSNSNSSTVKTFTSNGNHQALTKSIDTQLLSLPRNETENSNFLSNYSDDSVHHNSVTIEALAQALNSTTTGENTPPDAIIDDSGNRNPGEGENSISNSNGNVVDGCGDLSKFATNINHMITRGNLYKLNFDAAETELNLIERNLSGSVECLASNPDDSFMEDDGTDCYAVVFRPIFTEFISRTFQTIIHRHRRLH